MTSSDVLDLSLFLEQAQHRLPRSSQSLTQCDVENHPHKGFKLWCGYRCPTNRELVVTLIARLTCQTDSRARSTLGSKAWVGKDARSRDAFVQLWSSSLARSGLGSRRMERTPKQLPHNHVAFKKDNKKACCTLLLLGRVGSKREKAPFSRGEQSLLLPTAVEA